MKKFFPGRRTGDSEAEINYYVGQLKQELKGYFTHTMKKRFIMDAKKYKQSEYDIFEFAQIFLQQQKRKQELEQIKQQTQGKKLKIKTLLKEHFEDRRIAKEKDFKRKGAKPSGASAGYVAKKKVGTDGLPFMMKVAKKAGPRTKPFDDMNFVNEYVVALLYKRILYDRTPVIELVESDNKEELRFRSKFLHDFQTVSQFTKGLRDNVIGSESAKLEQTEGAEKLFASMLALGEYDIHAGNIGVMYIKDKADEKGKWVLAKIDHGWSATQFFTDPSIVLSITREVDRFN